MQRPCGCYRDLRSSGRSYNEGCTGVRLQHTHAVQCSVCAQAVYMLFASHLMWCLPACLKIFVSYLQVVTVISKIKLTFPQAFVKSMFLYTNQVRGGGHTEKKGACIPGLAAWGCPVTQAWH